MTWSYDVSQRTGLHQVRERIGDTVAASPLIANEIIEERLAANGGDVRRTAIECARMGLMQLARKPDRSAESMSITRARMDVLRDLIADLEADAGAAGEAFVGGISIADDRATFGVDWRAHTFAVGGLDRDYSEGEG